MFENERCLSCSIKVSFEAKIGEARWVCVVKLVVLLFILKLLQLLILKNLIIMLALLFMTTLFSF